MSLLGRDGALDGALEGSIRMQQLELLMQYQGIEKQVMGIENELRNAPVRKKLLHARNYLVTTQNNLKKMESESAELTKTLEITRNRFQEVSKEMEEMGVHFDAADEESDSEDVADMRRQAVSIQNRLGQLERELLSILKHLGSMDQEIRKMAANIPKARQDYNELKTVYDAELAQINERTAPLKAQLQQMEGSIDPDLMRRYKSARAAGANPIVPLSGNRCNGCNMEIPSASAKRIREDGVILECENCGRLLYAPKD